MRYGIGCSLVALLLIGIALLWLGTSLKSRPIARSKHTATLLQDGRVLIVGGHGIFTDAPNSVMVGSLIYTDCEIHDPQTGRFSATGELNVGRESHAAVRLPSGEVLVAGGSSDRSGKMDRVKITPELRRSDIFNKS